MIKLVIITAAFLALGLFILPSTVSLFAGEHSFYNLNQGYKNKCIKCHADIYDELKESANHSTIDGDYGWSGEECQGCHRANSSIQYASAEANRPGEEAHAATTVSCGFCHLNITDAPVAGGFGQSPMANDTGIYASHYSFVTESRESDLLKSESESCVACHTASNIRINFTVNSKAYFASNNSYNTTASHWKVENMNITEKVSYTEVKQ